MISLGTMVVLLWTIVRALLLGGLLVVATWYLWTVFATS